ncbi:hypothetical protein [Sulfurirhabdus autotrophica]|nr:hypothetical protein [Sulfurirhabdus autotrophica]
MRQIKKRCIFCGDPANSKEHLWADWLKRYVPRNFSERIHQASISRFDAAAEEYPHYPIRETLRPGDPHSQKLRIVCSTCNNEWMAFLQEETKPILIPLITGEFLSLTPGEMNLLSRWATMFTMIAEFKDRLTIVTPQNQRDQFMNSGALPNNWLVSLGRYSGQKWVGVFNHLALHIPDSRDRTIKFDSQGCELQANSQCTTFAIGKVIFNTFSCVEDNLFASILEQYQEFCDYFKLSLISKGQFNNFADSENTIDDNSANLLSNSPLLTKLSDHLRPPT